jgi:hypothetical protein
MDEEYLKIEKNLLKVGWHTLHLQTSSVGWVVSLKKTT